MLVTGANGLLGRSTIQTLSSTYEVHALVHVFPHNPVRGVIYHVADLSAAWDIKDLPSQFDTIIHLAQSPKFRDFPNSALDVFKVNIESTARLLDFAKRIGAKQFVYASTGGVYGYGGEAFKENAPIVPLGQLGYYFGSKTCGEILVQSYASLFQVVVLRPFFMYGPRQNRRMLIPRLFDSVATGRPITLQGKDGIRINPIHVEDAVQAVLAAIDRPESAVYNIAGLEVFSLRQIAEIFAVHLGLAPVFEAAGGEPQDVIADISLMRSKLHEPQRLLLESIADIAV